MHSGLTQLSLVALSAALAAPAFAQPADPPQPAESQPAESQPAASQSSRTTVYEAAFFSQYAPSNALDIARQVPGFTLDLGNLATRGFAGAAGNVVINGSRPSSKAETLQTTLTRIPANRVIRVEVGPGDLYGAEYAGRNQVLNVILSAESGIDGNVTASGKRLYNGKIVPNLSASALIKRGASSINLAAGTERYDQVEEGTDTLTDPLTGDLIEHRRKINRYNDRAPYVSGSWALERASDNAVRLNARYAAGPFYLVQENHVTPVGDVERDDDLVQDFNNPVFEVGGDITRPLAKGAIKLVGLATRRKRDNEERYRFRVGEETLGGVRQTQDAQRNETLARLTWNRSNLAGFSFETGIEAVLNTLDAQTQLFDIGPGGVETRIELPIDDATVKEKRAEGFVNVGRQINPKLRLDGGLTFEYSQLKVRGDTTADRTLKFLKPNFTIDWQPGHGWHTQFSVKRTVAQLDFYDFISSAELATDRVNGGNSELLPQRAWEYRLTIDHAILGDGLVRLDLGYDKISLLQDRVLIFDDEGNGFDAPGNIGTGKRSFAKLTVDAPLTKLGLKGARLKFNGQLQRTRVEDPISGETRNFTGDYPDWNWNVEYRQDLGAFSYGFNVSDVDRITFFRTNEFDTNWNHGLYGTAFVEYRPNGRTTITLDVDNMLNTQARRNRLLFFPDRTNPVPEINEFRERNRHVAFALTLKRTFGGGSGTNDAGVAPVN